MKKTILYTTCFLFFILVWLLAIKKENKKGEQIRDEYPLITSKDKIEGTIKNLRVIKGGCFIKMNGESFRLLSSQNYLYKKEYIDNNISVGDSIFKNANSDTLYIYSSDGKEKYFVHNQGINRDKR